ncbi:D-aminoacid aminotransferase-like PLP-dependent enzyme [Gymnopus androsaceus JB14]|uniref:D-aminoacid aminotransferase-like PLP-dependent enzyme n=1 Tax=Gymnopus androsaceus JB14 TaxID=1447944 RepID=A0A6A4IIN6_9AGAR|nr:D-aminoacid aminotransferase-like PLP-dependent enzyme [Gymnopus androsaceus JB14]
MYFLLSSTRYDETLLKFSWNDDFDGPSPFFLLPYHFDRLIGAAEQHGWLQVKQSLSYEILKQKCHEKVKEVGPALKVRITLSEAGDVYITVSPVTPFTSDPIELVYFNPTTGVPPNEGSIVTVFLDSQATPSSLFTRTKTTQRVHYDEARRRAKIASPTSEVILFNDDSLITEASISSVCFFRSGHWLTPSTSTGCLPGVLRRWLLEKELVVVDNKKQLTTSKISEGDWVLLSNGVQGCKLGRITLVKE